jgi:sigma-B regulation protein RsbU (phosphoserine phosphatase)
MSNLQAAVRAFAQEGAAPAAVCANVNRLLCRNMASGRFVTFCYAYIDPSRRKLTYANAGHNPQLVVRAGGGVDMLVPGGTVLGVFSESTYEQGDFALAPGDRLVFYTDGITEGRNPAGEEFGEEQLAAAAIRHRSLAAEQMLGAVLRDVEQFNAGAYEDDATLIVGAL